MSKSGVLKPALFAIRGHGPLLQILSFACVHLCRNGPYPRIGKDGISSGPPHKAFSWLPVNQRAVPMGRPLFQRNWSLFGH